MRSRAPFAVRGYAFSPENVGTLVCPAIYDLGEAVTVVALSVTEGEDKPLQYAPMFRGADAPGLTELGAPLSGPVRAVADVAVEINRHRLEEQGFVAQPRAGADVKPDWWHARARRA